MLCPAHQSARPETSGGAESPLGQQLKKILDKYKTSNCFNLPTILFLKARNDVSKSRHLRSIHLRGQLLSACDKARISLVLDVFLLAVVEDLPCTMVLLGIPIVDLFLPMNEPCLDGV